MRAPGSVGGAKLRLLLASSSVAALLIGGGVPHAYACTAVPTSGVSNSGTVSGYCVTNETVNGNIDNSGTISPSGISFTNGTLNGSIYNSAGTIAGGITLDSTSKITAPDSGIGDFYGIQIEGANFSGGINNAGTILSTAAVGGGIVVNNADFTGGVTNSGTISSGNTAINVSVFNGTFQGGIT